MKFLTKVGTVFDRIIGSLAFVAGILIIFIMLAIGSEIVTRYFLGKPPVGVMDISEIAILYITFLGAAWLLSIEGHVKMDIVLNRLRPRAQSIFNIVTSIVAAIICLILFWFSTEVTWDTFQRGLWEVGIMEIPTFTIVLIIPIGSLMLFIQFLRRAYGYWRRPIAPPAKAPVTAEYEE